MMETPGEYLPLAEQCELCGAAPATVTAPLVRRFNRIRYEFCLVAATLLSACALVSTALTALLSQWPGWWNWVAGFAVFTHIVVLSHLSLEWLGAWRHAGLELSLSYRIEESESGTPRADRFNTSPHFTDSREFEPELYSDWRVCERCADLAGRDKTFIFASATIGANLVQLFTLYAPFIPKIIAVLYALVVFVAPACAAVAFFATRRILRACAWILK
jgi:hypothetical protein